MQQNDLRDRTPEFNRIVATMRERTAHPAAAPRRVAQRSEFSEKAATIGGSIASASDKLKKLTQLTQRRSLFDDPAEEITELTFIIKTEITQMNSTINELQQAADADGAGFGEQRQQVQHSKGVLGALKSGLANTTEQFKTVLSLRSETMRANHARRSEIMPTGGAVRPSNVFANVGSGGVGAGEGARQRYSSGASQGGGGGGGSGGQTDQMTMYAPQESSYLSDRARDVEQVESTIAELGGIFQHLATLVTEHGEMVTRIDQNVEDLESNVTGAQDQLLKYFESVSSNRMLIAQIFAVLMFFAGIWVTFLV